MEDLSEDVLMQARRMAANFWRAVAGDKHLSTEFRKFLQRD
jgi:hypothetical protein